MPVAFTQALQTGDLTAAFKVWTRIAEDTLFEVAAKQGHHIDRSTTRRGEVKYQEVRAFPKVFHSQASTMADRKVLKAINRAQEVLRAAPGHRRDRTWELLPEVLSYVPESHQQSLQSVLCQRFSPDSAQRALQVLKSALEVMDQANRTQRVQVWKRRLRSSATEAQHWLSSRTAKPMVHITCKGTRATAANGERLALIREAWDGIFQAHKNGEPELRRFMDVFGSTLQRSLCQLPKLTGDTLRAQILRSKFTSPGPDHWSFSELFSLAAWAPSMFDHLAKLLSLSLGI